MKSWMLIAVVIALVVVLANEQMVTPTGDEVLTSGRTVMVDALPIGFEPPLFLSLEPEGANDGSETPAVNEPEPQPPVHDRDLIQGTLVVQSAADSVIDELRIRLAGLGNPMPGSVLTAVAGQLPGAPRAYRNGTHQGLDFYGGACGREVRYGDVVVAAGDGVVIRADVSYVELGEQDRNEMLAAAAGADDTPPDILDKLHGAQVWIDHGNGVVTRYSHLADVTVEVGQSVLAGEIIGTVGNSGTSAAARGTHDGPHLHFEIHVQGRPFWDGLAQQQMISVLTEILGR